MRSPLPSHTFILTYPFNPHPKGFQSSTALIVPYMRHISLPAENKIPLFTSCISKIDVESDACTNIKVYILLYSFKFCKCCCPKHLIYFLENKPLNFLLDGEHKRSINKYNIVNPVSFLPY